MTSKRVHIKTEVASKMEFWIGDMCDTEGYQGVPYFGSVLVFKGKRNSWGTFILMVSILYVEESQYDNIYHQ